METIQNFDYAILNIIQQSLHCKFLDLLALILSYITTLGIIWFTIGIIMLLFHRTRATGIVLLVTLIFAFFTSDVLIKHFVNRPRPFTLNTDIILLINTPSGSSFPSTHSCLAAAATTVIFKKNKIFGLISAILTVCIAFSRIYLYVHYPTDVFCGLILGILCALITLWFAHCMDLDKRILRNKNSKL